MSSTIVGGTELPAVEEPAQPCGTRSSSAATSKHSRHVVADDLVWNRALNGRRVIRRGAEKCDRQQNVAKCLTDLARRRTAARITRASLRAGPGGTGSPWKTAEGVVDGGIVTRREGPAVSATTLFSSPPDQAGLSASFRRPKNIKSATARARFDR